jgi:chromosome segregation ATPase
MSSSSSLSAPSKSSAEDRDASDHDDRDPSSAAAGERSDFAKSHSSKSEKPALPSYVKELITPADRRRAHAERLAEAERKHSEEIAVMHARLREEMGALETDIGEYDTRIEKLKETNAMIVESYMDDDDCRVAYDENIATIDKFTGVLLDQLELFREIMRGEDHPLFAKYRDEAKRLGRLPSSDSESIEKSEEADDEMKGDGHGDSKDIIRDDDAEGADDDGDSRMMDDKDVFGDDGDGGLYL